MAALIPVIAGGLLAAAALAFVLAPLGPRWRRSSRAGSRGDRAAAGRGRSLSASEARDASAVVALREIEFDRETGKLSESDYAALKATYTERALSELRAATAGAAPAAPAPSAATAARAADPGSAPVCVECGPRPQADALYCSRCGRYLAGACGACGAPVIEPAAQYCTACGEPLAAASPAA